MTSLRKYQERLSERMMPLAPHDYETAHIEALGALREHQPVANVYATFVKSPLLFRKFSPFANYILNRSSLTKRQRELLIIRVGHANRCEYELSKHVPAGRRAGLDEDEIAALLTDNATAGIAWAPGELTLINVVDELVGSHTVGDATWAELASEFTEAQIVDILFTAGAYNMVSWSLNALHVQLDATREP
jgi:AhpD family alkylhydroperoxidase